MRSCIENIGGDPFRCTVFGSPLKPGSFEQLLAEGERKPGGRWHWKLDKAAEPLISGRCHRCDCLELRGFGWASVACLNRDVAHLWSRPLT